MSTTATVANGLRGSGCRSASQSYVTCPVLALRCSLHSQGTCHNKFRSRPPQLVLSHVVHADGKVGAHKQNRWRASSRSAPSWLSYAWDATGFWVTWKQAPPPSLTQYTCCTTHGTPEGFSAPGTDSAPPPRSAPGRWAAGWPSARSRAPSAGPRWRTPTASGQTAVGTQWKHALCHQAI